MMTNDSRFRAAAVILLGLISVLWLAACASQPDYYAFERDIDGDPVRGAEMLASWGCGSCHTIPGVADANAHIGPPLTSWAKRMYIAGNLINQPDNLISWIMDPQEIEPGTVMPDLDVPEDIARDMAAYLYTIDE